MLKIYTAINKHYTSNDVGIVMLNENNEIYFQSAFRVVNTEESEGHIFGIKRALSFIKNVRFNNKTDNKIICIFSTDEERWINLRLEEDRYIRNIKKLLNINLSTKQATKEDEKNLLLAKQQYLMLYKNDKITFNGFTK